MASAKTPEAKARSEVLVMLETAIDGSSTEGEMKGQITYRGQSSFTQSNMTFDLDIDVHTDIRQVQGAEK